jgi:predicted ribonuclease YlaK
VNLILTRSYASKSSSQQDLVVSQLRSIDNEARRLSATSERNEALGQSILDFLSRNISTPDKSQYKTRLQEELIRQIYDEDSQSAHKDTLKISPSRQRSIEQAFSKSLQYAGMDDRAGRIVEAHEETFQWIYEKPRSDTRQWSCFRTWLESDEQLYWITGKAGSGKSTLLKYLCDDPGQRVRCLKYLSTWGRGTTSSWPHTTSGTRVFGCK